ncbi:hypothetical protein B0H11DRAFT_1914359 [Mycena galericulata]|nr:hypothetical protein B0H11DRAFT_1914359 [Mycena galericulata]
MSPKDAYRPVNDNGRKFRGRGWLTAVALQAVFFEFYALGRYGTAKNGRESPNDGMVDKILDQGNTEHETGNLWYHAQSRAKDNDCCEYSHIAQNSTDAVYGRRWVSFDAAGRTAISPFRIRPSNFFDGSGRPAVDGTRHTGKDSDGGHPSSLGFNLNSGILLPLPYFEFVLHRKSPPDQVFLTDQPWER